MKKPAKRGRKPTNRTAIIYGRVSPRNKQWFKKFATSAEVSLSEGLDQAMNFLRKESGFEFTKTSTIKEARL